MAKPTFPEPDWYNGRKRFRLSALLRYEAEVAGEPAPEPLPPEKEVFLSAAQVKSRYGVSDMWLHRRRNEAATEPSC